MAVPSQLSLVAVVGNGIMGHGIAQVFSVAGADVLMVGRSEESLVAARDRVRASLEQFVEHGLIDAASAPAALERVRTTTRLEECGAAELVIEAVPEDTELKLEIFGRLDEICPPPAVLASASGRPVSTLAERVRQRQRLVAAHFWNPAQLLPLVEVSGAPDTDPAVVTWVIEQLSSVGKQPVLLDREIDGFIGNRLQFALLREALALWSSGVASAEAIDTAVRASFGRRLSVTGPLESAQLGGLHTMYEFSRFLFPDLDNSAEPPKAMLDPGLYAWDDAARQRLLAERYRELFRQLTAVAAR